MLLCEKGDNMTSIIDVAKKAGVSKTTVSRVLLGSDKVKPATKERVLQVIEEMNYSPVGTISYPVNYTLCDYRVQSIISV